MLDVIHLMVDGIDGSVSSDSPPSVIKIESRPRRDLLPFLWLTVNMHLWAFD